MGWRGSMWKKRGRWKSMLDPVGFWPWAFFGGWPGFNHSKPACCVCVFICVCESVKACSWGGKPLPSNIQDVPKLVAIHFLLAPVIISMLHEIRREHADLIRAILRPFGWRTPLACLWCKHERESDVMLENGSSSVFVGLCVLCFRLWEDHTALSHSGSYVVRQCTLH